MKNYDIQLLLTIQKEAKSLEDISPAKAFQKYDEALNLIFNLKMEGPVDVIDECNYRRDLMYGKSITKKQLDKDVKVKIEAIRDLKDNPAALAALCKLYLVALSYFYFNNKLDSREVKDVVAEINTILQQVKIKTRDSENLERFLNEIRSNENDKNS